LTGLDAHGTFAVSKRFDNHHNWRLKLGTSVMRTLPADE